MKEGSDEEEEEEEVQSVSEEAREKVKKTAVHPELTSLTREQYKILAKGVFNFMMADSEEPQEKAKTIRVKADLEPEEEEEEMIPSVTCEVQVLRGVGKAKTIKVHPDTGTTMSVVSLNLIRKLGFSEEIYQTPTRLSNASGVPIAVVGGIELVMRHLDEKEGRRSIISILVSPDLPNSEFLLGYRDQQWLGILPPGY